MLRIYSPSTGLALELDPDISVEFELNNILLAESGEMPGSFSYPITFPLSPNNRRFLGHDYLPQANLQEHAVETTINGILLTRCTLSYKVDSSTKASGFLKIDQGEIANQLKGVYLWQALEEKVYLFDPEKDDVATHRTSKEKQELIQARMLEMAEAEPGEYPIVFFPVYNADFAMKEVDSSFPVRTFEYNAVVNPFENGKFKVDVYTVGRHFTPFIYLTYVFERIAAFFGYSASGSFLTDPDVRTWVLFNTQAIPSTRKFSSNGAFFVDLSNHVPYITISDFLKTFRDELGLGIFFDSRTKEVRYELFRDILKSGSSINLSSHLLSGYSSENTSTDGYTILSAIDENDLIQKSNNRVSEKIGTGGKDIQMKISTLAMQAHYMNFGGGGPSLAYLPTCSIRGNLSSREFQNEEAYYSIGKEHKNSFGIRLLSYRGMREGSVPNKKYPFGTSGLRDYNQELVGTLSLTPTDQKSVFNLLTVPYYQFRATARRMTLDFLLPLSRTKEFPLNSIYTVQNANRIVSQILISRLVYVAPGKNGLIPARANALVISPINLLDHLSETNDIFYVEFELINHRIETSVSLRDGDTITTTNKYADLAIRTWKDALKTEPANPTNFPVILTEEIQELDDSKTWNRRVIYVTGHEHITEEIDIEYSVYLQEKDEYEEKDIHVYILEYSSDYIALK